MWLVLEVPYDCVLMNFEHTATIGKAGEMRLRIDFAYDGTNFSGWAKQPNLRTVQGVMEDALNTLLRTRRQNVHVSCSVATAPAHRFYPIHLTVAGRTDAGVHAAHQVCHVDADACALEHLVGHMAVTPIKALELRLSRMLPDDIAIQGICVAPEGFDARFSALERTYIYRIADGQSRADPRLNACVFCVDDVLDVSLMDQAARMMIGLHDFGSFAKPNPGGTTIREVKVARWQRRDLSETSTLCIPRLDDGLIEFTIVADAFAHNMVRSLVQASLQIGRHKKSLAWFEDKIAHPVREGSTGPIAPQGLTLEYVAYPCDEQLASRAQAIRAKRTLE